MSTQPVPPQPDPDPLVKELLQKSQELDGISADLQAIAYAISHDLRAPLRAVRGFAEILSSRNRDQLPPDAQRSLDNILEASEQMELMAGELVRYIRVGGRGVTPRPIELAPLFQRVLADLAPAIQTAHAEIRLPDELPTVLGDPKLLAKVFGPLLENSLKYRRQDVRCIIDIDWRKSGDAVSITVADNGIGIDPQYHNKIFEIFQRLHSQEAFPGAGIGLSIVRKAVTLMHGSVSVESTGGPGSTFRVELPLADPAPSS